MNSRLTVLAIGVGAACFLLAVGGGCGAPAAKQQQDRDYNAMAPAARLLLIETEGPAAPGAQEALEQMLDDRNPIYRVEAAQTLGTWAGVGNPRIALKAVTSRDSLVRSIAQAAYADHNPNCLGVLVVGNRMIEVPPAILQALAALDDPQGTLPPAKILMPMIDRLRPKLGLEAGDTPIAIKPLPPEGTTEAVQALAQMEEIVLAADVLSRVGDVGARRVLVKLVETAEGDILAKAARVCSRDDQDLGTTLLPVAFSDGILARRATMEALVVRPNPWLSQLAVKGMGDVDPIVRRNAIRALGNMGGAAPLDPLKAVLATGLPNEQLDVIQALGGLGGMMAPDLLRGYIRHGPPTPSLKLAALVAFAPYANRDDIPWVTTELKAKEPELQAAALKVLGRITDPEAQATIMAMAKSPDPLIRATTAEALGELKTVYASMQLVRMLADAEPRVRALAATGLGHSRYAEAVPALVKLATSPMARPKDKEGMPAQFGNLIDWPELAAIAALGQIGGASATTTLRGLLDSKEWLVRATAAQALGASGDPSPETAKALEAHLKDPVNLVKGQAYLSLKALGSPVTAD
jgi:HEAT repeat protein